jgi:photosystem II stability/assembly factor-like uncharacterized protein
VSSDNGTTWTTTNSGLLLDSSDLSSLEFLASSEKWVFAAHDHGFFISPDSGNSWNSIGASLPAPNIYRWWIQDVICVDSVILLATFTHVFRSNDTGKTWELADSGLPLGGDSLNRHAAYSLAKMGKDIFAATDSGVFKSTNNGSSWFAMNKNTNVTAINSFAVSGNNLYVGTKVNGYHSVDSGDSWKRMNVDEINVLAANGNLLVAGKGIYNQFNSGTVNFSTDNGKTWWNRYFHKTFAAAITSLAMSGNYVFAGMLGYSGIMVSSDSGRNWDQQTDGILPPTITSYNVHTYCLAAYDGAVFTYSSAPQNNRRFFRTTDNGKNWIAIDSGLTMEVYSFCAHDPHYYAGTHYGLFHSSDRGAYWRLANTGFKNITALVALGKNVFAGTDKGVFLSSDDAQTWIAVDSGNPDRNITALAIQNNNIFSGTVDGHVYRTSLSEFALSGIRASTLVTHRNCKLSISKKSHVLFNVSFSLHAPGRVLLTVYSLAGRRMAVIANEQFETGAHELKWDARCKPAANGVFTNRDRRTIFIIRSLSRKWEAGHRCSLTFFSGALQEHDRGIFGH